MADDKNPTAIDRYKAGIQSLTRQVSRLAESLDAGRPPHVTDLDELRVAEQTLVEARRALVALLRNGVDEPTPAGRLEVVRPHSWKEVASSLGITRQAAQKSYQGIADELAGGRRVTRVIRDRRAT